jgi:hypothetical protein
MDEGAMALAIFSSLFASVGWLSWWTELSKPHAALQLRTLNPAELVGAPIAAAVVIAVLVRITADHAVRASLLYIWMYTAVGMLLLGFAMFAMRVLGFSSRTAVETANRPAAVFNTAAILAYAVAYAGGNAGEGPGPEAVFFSAFVALAILFLFIGALVLVADLPLRVYADRSWPAALRLTGLILAAGLIAGRAVSGNWRSVEHTLADAARISWVLLIPVTVEAVLPRVTNPTPASSRATTLSAAAGLGYITAAAFYLSLRGRT